MDSSVILIDAKNFLYRHHHTHKLLAASDGFPTSVLHGAAVAMLSLAKRFPGAAIVFVWDGCGPTWRHKLLASGPQPKSEPLTVKKKPEVQLAPKVPYMDMSMQFIKQSAYQLTTPKALLDKVPKELKQPREKKVGYKANRPQNPEVFAAAQTQIPVFREFLTKIGVRQFEIDYLEGDDMMGVLVTWIEEHNIFDEIIIHSSDRDFYQFISDKTHVLRSVREGGFAQKKEIYEEFGVTCADFTKLRAIIGDSSDNIPHLFDGVGSKTAAKWIQLGLNPSVEHWDDLTRDVRKTFLKMDKYDVRGMWPMIHRNYLASQIVRTSDHPFLSNMVKNEIDLVLDKVSRGSLLTDGKVKTDATWRWLTMYCAQYGLSELHGRRSELWSLP